ncbi:response regulator transcription factor [Alkalihalobacillus sp. CinArs1]|uniref:response regulator transcription factor n=1 Tax=Alkalihalobacillus sp. CinArs1 TaxID=2995314 RepID=UPI0022DD0763|nr:response regulator transcription factor [Alkalihalobacillus sp. CinArs1]
MAQKILVVEDEMSIMTLLQFNLEQAGYEVVTAEDGAEALQKIEVEKPNCIILDLMLPEMDGLEVCKEMRSRHIYTPVLMLTAKDDEFDKVLGLELGADDYMTKPFSPREVVARVKAILRRIKQMEGMKGAPEEAERIQVGELDVYPNNYEAYFKGELMEVTPKEFELLVYLVRHKGRVLTREQLLSAVWNYDFVGDTRIVDVHVSHLREKIEENTRKPEYIKTIRGLGYKLEGPSS